jgi:hypothetical protein
MNHGIPADLLNPCDQRGSGSVLAGVVDDKVKAIVGVTLRHGRYSAA